MDYTDRYNWPLKILCFTFLVRPKTLNRVQSSNKMNASRTSLIQKISEHSDLSFSHIYEINFKSFAHFAVKQLFSNLSDQDHHFDSIKKNGNIIMKL